MKRSQTKLIGVAVAIVVILYLLRALYVGVYGHRGVAQTSQDLVIVYQSAQHGLAAFSTNAFLNKLSFVDPISWRRREWRPSVYITGRVDVAAFRRDMSPELFVYLHSKSFSQEPSSVYDFEILSRSKDYRVLKSQGELDVSSGAFSMVTYPFYTKVEEDGWWYKLTNGGTVQFPFDADGLSDGR
jgi:hypothetical protein